jgi:2Fe-2S ferredoxin
MPKIEFVKLNRASFDVEISTNLMTALLDAGIPVASSCQGDGVCGKCALRVFAKTGTLIERTDQENQLLSKSGRTQSDYRISCQFQVTQNILVDADYW